MRNVIVSSSVKLVTEICVNCGVLFAMPDELRDEKMRYGTSFYCPNGHSMSWTETTVSRLEREKKELAKQVEKERSDKAWYIGRLNTEQTSHRHTSNRLRGTQAVVTRYKKRIIAGSCVCCSKKFKDLERHMKNQHPDWNPDKHVEALAEKTK